MAHWLEKYRDFEIEVFYLTDSGFRDRGRLIDLGDNWIELYKNNNETLLIPVSSIRMAKVLVVPSHKQNRLLRPASPPSEMSTPDDEN